MNSTLPVPSVTYVTAFLDIGRNNWVNFRRTTQEYLTHFSPFISLMKKSPQDTLIVYLDETIVLSEDIPDNVRIIPITEKKVGKISPLWRRLDREREIMLSTEYKNRFSTRLHFPENYNPKYTLINHAKIDFVNHAMTLSDTEYFCWVDFGYFQKEDRIPLQLLDPKLFQVDKITYTLINEIDDRDKNLDYTLLQAPEKIGGFFFFGNRFAMIKYQLLYHKIHAWFQTNNLADDDQCLALQCYLARPDLFSLPVLGGWHKALTHFQKKD